jgi:hypothetical protein
MLDSLKDFNPRSLTPAHLLGSPSGVRTLSRVVVVLATLLLAYYLGKRPDLTYVTIPIVLVLAWLVYTRPHLGVVGLLVSALLVPFVVGTNSGSPLNVAFLAVPLLGALWLVEMIRKRSIRFAPSLTTLPLIGLVTTASISFLVGYLPWNVFAQLAPLRAQLGAWAIFAFSAGAFWLAANRIRDIVWLKRLVWAFLALGALFIVGRLAGARGYPITNLYTFGSTGSLFWVWLVVLAAGQALFNRDLAWPWRLALGALVGLTFVVALTGDSLSWASGWVPPLVGLSLVIWLRWPRGAILLGALAALAALLDFRVVQNVLFTDNQYSILTRGAALTIVLEIVKASPLLGVGPANYYYYTPLYPILGYYVRFNSHNNYVDILAQTGLVGAFFFAWFVLATARVGWILRSKFTDGFARAYIYSCLAGLAATLVACALGDWFLPFVYNIGIAGFRASVLAWLFLGGLVALEQISKAPAEVEASTAAA